MKNETDYKYGVAGLLCLLFVMTRYFAPEFFDNEWVYCLNPIKILRPDFLANDYFLDRIFPYFIVYDGLVSPLYFLLDPLAATLICRVAIWSFQIWALARLTKTLGVAWWGFVLVFVLMIDVEQTLVAGEWIIGCASAKPVSYGFVFLALDNVLRGKEIRGAIYSGLAASFHILVGIWFGVALFLGCVAVRYRTIGLGRIALYILLTALFALPGIIPALSDKLSILHPVNLQVGLQGAPTEAAKISVLVANPFHLDPNYFMTGLEYLKVPLVFILCVITIHYTIEKKISRPIVLTITSLLVLFLSGLVARKFEMYRYLQYYPFRVADALIPLFLWIGIALLLQKVHAKMKRSGILLFAAVPLFIGTINFTVDRFEPAPKYGFTSESFLKAMLTTEPRLTAYWIRERVRIWYSFFETERKKSDLENIEVWIKENVPQGKIIIIPPWEISFSVTAERPAFVNMKYIPPNESILEWRKRIQLLNKGKINSVGRETWQELTDNYQNLTEKDFLRIKDEYSVSYVLTNSKTNLGFELIRREGLYSLYRL